MNPTRTLAAESETLVLLHGTLFGERAKRGETPLDAPTTGRLIAALDPAGGRFTPYDLDGDCSLAIVDGRTGELTVYSDRLGFRRVFYYRDGDLLVVSTRLPLLLALIPIPWHLDLLASRIYLAQREPKWPRSIVREVAVLPPVHELRFGDAVTVRNYWRPEVPVAPRSFEEGLDDLRRTILFAIARRTRLGPTALYMSGGTDSSCLAKLMTGDRGVTAISAGYEGDASDESLHAERITREIGLEFMRVPLGNQKVDEILMRMPDLIDQPAHDPTSYFLLSEAAHRMGFECALNGMGGDAIFADKRKGMAAVAGAWPFLRIAAAIPARSTILRTLGTLGRWRGPLHLLRPWIDGPAPASVNELWQRQALSSTAVDLLGPEIRADVSEITRMRAPVFERARVESSSPGQWHYLWALWDGPDEYHADLTITTAGMMPVMPFAEGLVADAAFALSRARSLESRAVEIRMVGGIPERLLVQRKQGFHIPYRAYSRELLVRTIDHVLEQDGYRALRIRPGFLESARKQAQEYLDGQLPMDTRPLWRLTVLMQYVKQHGLRI